MPKTDREELDQFGEKLRDWLWDHFRNRKKEKPRDRLASILGLEYSTIGNIITKGKYRLDDLVHTCIIFGIEEIPIREIIGDMWPEHPGEDTPEARKAKLLKLVPAANQEEAKRLLKSLTD